MKSMLKILVCLSVFLLALFLWQEFPDISLSKKINAEKISAFFTAIGSLLTAITIYLLYKQIAEQIEDRKASSRPDLYPENQFFTLIAERNFPKLSRENKKEALAGLISLHNIGLGAAKEIKVKWHFQKDILVSLINPELVQFYSNRETEKTYAFVSQNNHIDVQLPLMYLASLSSFESGWLDMIWEELFLEITYKDIHDFDYPPKVFKVEVDIGAHYAVFNFVRAISIILTKESTMRSRLFSDFKPQEDKQMQ